MSGVRGNGQCNAVLVSAVVQAWIASVLPGNNYPNLSIHRISQQLTLCTVRVLLFFKIYFFSTWMKLRTMKNQLSLALSGARISKISAESSLMFPPTARSIQGLNWTELILKRFNMLNKKASSILLVLPFAFAGRCSIFCFVISILCLLCQDVACGYWDDVNLKGEYFSLLLFFVRVFTIWFGGLSRYLDTGCITGVWWCIGRTL